MDKFLKSLIEGQGIWAGVSILLGAYTLRETEKRELRSLEREEKFFEIIDGFKEHFGQLTEKVNIIKVDVDDIKDELKRGDKNG